MNRLSAPALAMCTAALMIAAGWLVSDHLRVMADSRSSTTPLAANIAALERRHALILSQMELAELQAALRLGSHEERARVYALPEEFPVDRLVALFDAIHAVPTRADHAIAVDAVSFGDPVQVAAGLEALPVQVSLTADQRGLVDIERVLRLSGLLTVADALSNDLFKALLTAVEQGNPAGIVPLEQMLSTDLLAYAREPRPLEDHLRRSFGDSPVLQTVEHALGSALLQDMRDLLRGPLGAVFTHQGAWPLPLLTTEGIHAVQGRAPGWYALSLTVHVYRRTVHESL